MPIRLSCTNGRRGQQPHRVDTAITAAVPVPHGERSTSASAKIVTLRRSARSAAGRSGKNGAVDALQARLERMHDRRAPIRSRRLISMPARRSSGRCSASIGRPAASRRRWRRRRRRTRRPRGILPRRRASPSAPACSTNDGTLTKRDADSTALRLTVAAPAARVLESCPPARRRRSTRRARWPPGRRRCRPGHDQPALDRDRRHRDDAVAAHRAVALVVHEQHAGVGARRHRLGEDRAVHVGVAARLEHQRAAQMIRVRVRTHSRLSSIVLPRGDGKPSTISRSGSPAACASIVYA